MKTMEAVLGRQESRISGLLRQSKSFFMMTKEGLASEPLLLRLKGAAEVPLERLARSCGVSPARPIDRGTDLNEGDINERTQLIRAAANGDVARVKQLLEAGADTEIVDKDCMTALDWADGRGHAEIVEILKMYGAQERVP